MEKQRDLEFQQYKESFHASLSSQRNLHKVTQPKEFNLRTSQRGESYRLQQEELMRQQQEIEKKGIESSSSSNTMIYD